MNNPILGIDLGTTHSSVAIVDAGFPLVLADQEGHRLTPSVVHYPATGETPLVGRKAQRMRVQAPSRTIYDIKRFMGRSASDLSDREWEVDYELSRTMGEPLKVLLGDRTLRPEEVSATILAQLKRIAEQSMECSLERAVITVPAYFNDSQRQATLEAGRMAGLTVERILNEPTAAALSYGLNRLKENAKVAVYDLGGGTFDITILEMFEGVFRVLATHGNTQLGGRDLDQRIVDYCIQQCASSALREAIKSHPECMAKIRAAAEEAKITLSQQTEATIEIPFLYQEEHFSCHFDRDTLERLSQPLIEKTRAHCLRAMHDAKLEAQDLDQVILVGGQTRMPLIKQKVAEFFACSDFEENRGDIRIGQSFHEQEGPALHTGEHPDEAIALGAAIQGGILSGALNHLTLLDVTPLSLGLETFGGLMNVLIPRNSTIPTKAGEVFTTAVANQREMLIHVLQGERERAADNWSLGRFVVPFESAPRGVARVGVQFAIDANGILKVLARNLKDGTEQTLEIQSAIDVEDQQVSQMVESSVEHALDDMESRRWIEQKLKAQQLLQAVDSSLEACGTSVDGNMVEVIELKVSEVKQTLARENPETQKGDTARLKASMKELDEATQALAALLLDEVASKLLE